MYWCCSTPANKKTFKFLMSMYKHIRKHEFVGQYVYSTKLELLGFFLLRTKADTHGKVKKYTRNISEIYTAKYQQNGHRRRPFCTYWAVYISYIFLVSLFTFPWVSAWVRSTSKQLGLVLYLYTQEIQRTLMYVDIFALNAVYLYTNQCIGNVASLWYA